jgi:hypothetical protein
LRAYKESLANFQQFNNVTNALRKQIMNGIDEAYYKPLFNQHTGYNNVSVPAMLTHLFEKHGKIKPADLALNDERLCTAWDGAEPFELVIARIDECVEFASAGGDPYTAQQILTKAMNIVFKTGLYNDAVREWNRQGPALKTYANFQTHFIAAQEQLDDEQANMKQAGFGAHALVEQVQNLANVIVATNGQASSKLDMLSEQYASLKKENETLRALIMSAQNNNSKERRDNKNGKTYPPATDQGSYCWSHGYKCAKTHNSENCQYPKPGHVKAATRANNMGGSQRGKPGE